VDGAARSQTADLSALAGRARERVATRVHGKDEVIELALITMIAGGHLLIEDIPGVGKSTLAKSLAAAVGGSFHRVQFTSDLLPADLIGTNVWLPREERFEFRRGPIFANVVLADEVNRAPPRTQSALLEAMGEQQVSVDGVTHPLPSPFTVLATQNPHEHHGTYALPESQRDRFLLRVSMGYTDATTEAELLMGTRSARGDDMDAALDSVDRLVEMQDAASSVHLHPDLGRYAQAIVQATREHESIALGVSTRGALAWVAGARARAFLHERAQVSIDDLQALAVPALAHRIVPAQRGASDATAMAAERIRDVVASVAVPV
jgi:MoxR-like ATPase